MFLWISNPNHRCLEISLGFQRRQLNRLIKVDMKITAIILPSQ